MSGRDVEGGLGFERSYLVECLWPGVTEKVYGQAVRRAASAARVMAIDGAQLRFVDEVLVPDDEVAFFRFAGGSRTVVEWACVRAELPYQRILECVSLPDARNALPPAGDPGL